MCLKIFQCKNINNVFLTVSKLSSGMEVDGFVISSRPATYRNEPLSIHPRVSFKLHVFCIYDSTTKWRPSSGLFELGIVVHHTYETSMRRVWDSLHIPPIVHRAGDETSPNNKTLFKRQINVSSSCKVHLAYLVLVFHPLEILDLSI